MKRLEGVLADRHSFVYAQGCVGKLAALLHAPRASRGRWLFPTRLHTDCASFFLLDLQGGYFEKGTSL